MRWAGQSLSTSLQAPSETDSSATSKSRWRKMSHNVRYVRMVLPHREQQLLWGLLLRERNVNNCVRNMSGRYLATFSHIIHPEWCKYHLVTWFTILKHRCVHVHNLWFAKMVNKSSHICLFYYSNDFSRSFSFEIKLLVHTEVWRIKEFRPLALDACSAVQFRLDVKGLREVTAGDSEKHCLLENLT